MREAALAAARYLASLDPTSGPPRTPAGSTRSLRRVDREQPHRVGALLLRDRVALGRADRLLLLDEADETLDVRTAELLVRACEPRELAQVRVAAAPVPLSQ